jgi:hypothetical protein
MAIRHICTYLVRPGRGAEGALPIRGTELELAGRLFEMLERIFERSEHECITDISFTRSQDGRQENPCRSLFMDYLRHPSIDTGRAIAARLQEVTDHRSGLGLLFVMAGTDGAQHKLVVSRFPADRATLAADESDDDLYWPPRRTRQRKGCRVREYARSLVRRHRGSRSKSRSREEPFDASVSDCSYWALPPDIDLSMYPKSTNGGGGAGSTWASQMKPSIRRRSASIDPPRPGGMVDSRSSTDRAMLLIRARGPRRSAQHLAAQQAFDTSTGWPLEYALQPQRG